MTAGASPAFALIRVARGEARPSEERLRAALQTDRERLRQPAPPAPTEMQVAGPYHILVDGNELDEYVVWER
ncbi:hypothetical protein KF840_04405 [bacterium]|nr:hypothetical protein [bacterium]